MTIIKAIDNILADIDFYDYDYNGKLGCVRCPTCQTEVPVFFQNDISVNQMCSCGYNWTVVMYAKGEKLAKL